MRKNEQDLAQAEALLNLAKQQLKLSKQALQTAKNAYQYGQTNIQTLLQVQTQTLQAHLDAELGKVAVERQRAFYHQALGFSIATHLAQ